MAILNAKGKLKSKGKGKWMTKRVILPIEDQIARAYALLHWEEQDPERREALRLYMRSIYTPEEYLEELEGLRSFEIMSGHCCDHPPSSNW
jgi:hypothetical protein